MYYMLILNRGKNYSLYIIAIYYYQQIVKYVQIQFVLLKKSVYTTSLQFVLQ
ncbi:hypothetical protein FWK35_00015958 [Aphis craccivora]|uniref:Uncharacterized protein n=1 Tax=Aphis craccivora TaxID=307492 RepID=A0A6G0ZHJ7_APHCR|nr:hypothetical protein FWK35_00015958 [Aphis craccivora]